MIPLNFHHLYYFWVVAREGSITKACQTLMLTQPAISTQIMQLEKALKKKLFERAKRRLTLTPEGELVVDYANEIFGASRELLDALGDRPTRELLTVQVGLGAHVPKIIAQQTLSAAGRYRADTRVMVFEGTADTFHADLQTHKIDLAISDRDLSADSPGSYFKTEIACLPVYFVATAAVARRVRMFPQGLAQVPMILPPRETPVRNEIERYLNRHHIDPRVVAEVEDVELARSMALAGQGVTPVNRAAIHGDLKSGRLRRLERTSIDVSESTWLITRRRHHANPIAEYLLKNFEFKE